MSIRRNESWIFQTTVLNNICTVWVICLVNHRSLCTCPHCLVWRVHTVAAVEIPKESRYIFCFCLTLTSIFSSRLVFFWLTVWHEDTLLWSTFLIITYMKSSEVHISSKRQLLIRTSHIQILSFSGCSCFLETSKTPLAVDGHDYGEFLPHFL